VNDENKKNSLLFEREEIGSGVPGRERERPGSMGQRGVDEKLLKDRGRCVGPSTTSAIKNLM